MSSATETRTESTDPRPDLFRPLEANIWGEPSREKKLMPWLMTKPVTVTLKANQDNPVNLAGGAECIGVKIQNNSTAAIARELDAPAGPGSWNIAPGGSEYLDVFCSVIHIWVSQSTQMNDNQNAASVVVEAGLQP